MRARGVGARTVVSALALLAATVGWDIDHARRTLWVSLDGRIHVCRAPMAYATVSNAILGQPWGERQSAGPQLERWLRAEVPRLCPRER